MKKWIKRVYFGNCWLAFLLLLISGRAFRPILRRDFHLMGLTKRGNVVHYRRDKKFKGAKGCFPCCFRGYLEVTNYKAAMESGK